MNKREIKLFKHQQMALESTKNHNRVAVKGYEGLYEVDVHGNVYSIITTKSRRKCTLKSYINNSGYMRVNLYKNKKVRKFYVHRLVAEAFIPNPNNYNVVNHRDGDKTNNSVSNLQWCTQKENIKHSFENRLENRSIPTLVNGKLFPNMKMASLSVFGNNFEIAHIRRKFGNEFTHKGYLIKVGDAECHK